MGFRIKRFAESPRIDNFRKEGVFFELPLCKMLSVTLCYLVAVSIQKSDTRVSVPRRYEMSLRLKESPIFGEENAIKRHHKDQALS